MCVGSSPDAPTPPPRTPEAARAPEQPSSRGSVSQRYRAKSGMQGGVGTGTLLTSSRGVQDAGGAVTATKTLLGS